MNETLSFFLQSFSIVLFFCNILPSYSRDMPILLLQSALQP
jgi:hypothetical protein